ncbi:membrane-associating domain-containing protein [Xylariales sp. PMI_506]|nr:membrane-associating domain-containing protein [Xylariales sp. PMI_506]
MPSRVALGLHIAQGLVGVVVLGLSAYVVKWYNVDTLTAPPPQFSFVLFASIWTILSAVYLEVVPRFMPLGSHPFASLALEFTNVIFNFGGFVALAVFMSKLLFCRGEVCGSARATVVFGAAEFVLWTGSMVLMAIGLFKDDISFRRRVKGQMPLSDPPMAQVA